MTEVLSVVLKNINLNSLKPGYIFYENIDVGLIITYL